MVVNDAVLVEIKIAPQYDKRDEAQLLNMLKATGLKLVFCSISADTRSNINASSSESVFHRCLSVAYRNFLLNPRPQNHFPIAYLNRAEVVTVPEVSDIVSQSPRTVLPIQKVTRHLLPVHHEPLQLWILQ